MDPRYASAVAAAAASASNSVGNSPNGNDATMAHLQNLAGIQFGSGAAGHTSSALTGDASAVAAQQDMERKSQMAIDDNNSKINDLNVKAQEALSDPNAYTRMAASDGGYNFYDPSGKKISVQDYSKGTGKQIPDALAGSQNPQDQQFAKDYKTLLLYGHAMAGDQTALDDFKKSADGKTFLNNPANQNKTYADVVKDFQNHYSGYIQPQQMDSMPATNSQGQNVTNNAIDSGDPNFFSNLLGLYHQNGVTYR